MRFKVEFVLDVEDKELKNAVKVLGKKEVFRHGKDYVKSELCETFDYKDLQKVRDMKVFLEI